MTNIRKEEAYKHFWNLFLETKDTKYYDISRSIAIQIIQYEKHYKSFRMEPLLSKMFDIKGDL